jgi:hypothetical protein
MRPVPKDRAKNSEQAIMNVNLLDCLMGRDPSDNVMKQDGKNAPFSRNHEQKFSVSQWNVIVRSAM